MGLKLIIVLVVLLALVGAHFVLKNERPDG
jgi:hypothetical protein